jgi:hypothetical protein
MDRPVVREDTHRGGRKPQRLPRRTTELNTGGHENHLGVLGINLLIPVVIFSTLKFRIHPISAFESCR